MVVGLIPEAQIRTRQHYKTKAWQADPFRALSHQTRKGLK